MLYDVRYLEAAMPKEAQVEALDAAAAVAAVAAAVDQVNDSRDLAFELLCVVPAGTPIERDG